MEFSLVLIPFLFLVMGVIDLGRGIYTNNAVAEASREIARVTSVHPCVGNMPCVIGSTPETLAVIGTQRSLVPGLAAPVIECVDMSDTLLAAADCRPDPNNPGGIFVRVTVQAPFQVITPLLSSIGPSTFSSTSHVQLP
ncbi:MAG TPA: TadE family protein [Propionibacteriaceae bacterium]